MGYNNPLNPPLLRGDLSEVSHAPVLVEETLSALSCRKDVEATYLDCTVGMGGHTEAILKVTDPNVRVIGIDRDRDALSIAKQRLIPFQDRVTLCHGSLKALLEIAKGLGLFEVSGILFDLGISSMQLSSAKRGFSFQILGPLDMRMDPSLPITAATLINTLREKELADMIYQYGEEQRSRKIAAFIVRHREEKGEITQTTQLADIICRAVRQKSKWTRTHPATKTFQALRIAVNDELGELEAGLSHAVSLLAVGGRLVVISFHSLEDRPVKNRFRELCHVGAPHAAPSVKKFINLYKKPIIATREEVAKNLRARSAKLRALERVA
ncbi:MAG: 16S rRNA (cytosine(1402)-N(4))-methyltransferase RsmH [Nitrospirae bacterium]|nr:16S rRNA (cytosine(1402)-N(4))-methyltransferase RsmH [Candidatus Troglogloeales bacterium]